MVTDTRIDRNVEARRKLVRLELYRRAGRIGRSPSRAYTVAYVGWRLADLPLAPDPADFGLSEAKGAAWAGTVEEWLADAERQIGGGDA
jgi:hypothetical protein